MKKLIEEYFEWLISKDFLANDHGCSDLILRQMFETEYYFTHPMDQNRANDGNYLRYIFKKDNETKEDLDRALEKHCTLLEMFLAFSHRMCGELTNGMNPTDLFYFMLDEMGLTKYNKHYNWSLGDPFFEMDRIFKDYMDGKIDIFKVFPGQSETYKLMKENTKNNEMYFKFSVWVELESGKFGTKWFNLWEK